MKPRGLIGRTRRRDRLVTTRGEQRDGDGADPAGGAGDEDPGVSVQSVCFEREDARHRGETRGADDHGVARRDARRQRIEEVGGRRDELGEAAVATDAEVTAVHRDASSDTKLRIRRDDHGARRVDTADDLVEATNATRRTGDQGILEVDAAVVDSHQYVSGLELDQFDVAHLAVEFPVHLGDFKGSHVSRIEPNFSRLTEYD